MKVTSWCVVLGALGWAGGCSWTTSLDGLTGGAPALDASGEDKDSSLLDGSSTPLDGSGDGSDGSAAVFSCTSAPSTATLCEDFDTAPLPGAFGTTKTVGVGAVSIAVPGRSAPNSALFSISSGSGESAAALIRQGLPAVTKSAVIELDLRVESTGVEGFDVVTFASSPPEVGFQVEGNGALTWDEDVLGPPGTETSTGLAIALATWTHVRLSFVVVGDLATATLALDGGAKGTAMHTFQAKALLQGASLLVGDGSIQTSASPWRVLVDNVILTMQ